MKKQNGKVAIAIIATIIILLLAAGGAGAYIYFKTDLLKSPKELFSKYSDEGMDILEMEESEELMTSLEEITKGKFETNTTVSIEGKNILTMMFNDFKLKLDGAVDVDESKIEQNIDLLYKKDSLVKVSLLGAEDKFGIKDAEVLEKYLTVENRNLDKLLANLGVEGVEGIPSKIDLEEMNMELPEINIDVDKYINIVKDGMKDGKYSALKNEKINFNGEEVKANGYALSLSQENVRVILKNIVTGISAEDELLDVVAQFSQGQLTKQQIQLALNNLISELSVEKSDDELIRITVYENKGKTIRMKAEVFEEDEATISAALDIINSNEFLVTLVTEDAEMSMSFKKESANKISKYTIAIKQDGTEIFNVIIQIDGSEKDSIKTKLSFEIVGLAAIKVNNEVKKNNNVQITELTSTNTQVINDYSKAELETLVNELVPKFQEKYSERFENVMKNFEMLFQTIEN